MSASAFDSSDAISRMTGQNSNFSFDIRGAKGAEAIRKAYPHEELASWKIVPVYLKVQESTSDPIDVSRLYDLPPDTYSIQVTRRLPGGGYVSSKPISVEVTAP